MIKIIQETQKKNNLQTVPFITRNNQDEFKLYYKDEDGDIRAISLSTGESQGYSYESVSEAIYNFVDDEVMVKAEIVIKD